VTTHVVRIIARLNVGGPARHVVWLTEALNDGEFRTTLVTGTVPPGEEDMSDFARAHGVTPVVIREMSREISPRDVVTIWKAWRLLVRLRPDVVHTHTAKAGTVGRVAGMLYKYATPSILIGRPRRCRFIHTYHGHIFHSYYGRLKTRLFLAIERMLSRLNTDRIVVISEQQLRELRDTFRVGPARKFVVIALGVHLDEVRGTEAEGRALRERLGIGPEEIVVGIVGRLTPIKHHAMFLDVAARIGGRARMVIYGDGAERAALEQRAAELRLTNVVFAGTQPAPAIYASLDIAALTSLNEGTPLTLIEAMANAKPVISTAVGGVVDLLGGGERGIGVASRDVEGFTAGLMRLIDDAGLRRDLGRRGEEYVLAHYTKQRLIEDIKRVVRELMTG
jgi:glycosyltransferase involved in cell wall biosynthesis